MYAINKADMDDVIKPLEENSEHVDCVGEYVGGCAVLVGNLPRGKVRLAQPRMRTTR